MPRPKSSRTANGLGSIRKKVIPKNDGSSYCYWEGRCTAGYDPGTGKQIQLSFSAKTKKEVAAKMNQALYELNHNTYLPPNKFTVREWMELWTREYTGDIKPSTAQLYRKTIELYIIPGLGSTKLTSLTALMIQTFYNRLENLSPKTVRNIHGILHKALQQAVLAGYLRSNPTDACKLPRTEKKDIAPLDEQQVADFLVAIQDHPHEYLYKIVLFTGLREGEVLGLTWDCVDFENGTLFVKQQLSHPREKGDTHRLTSTKNGKSRVLALPPSVLRLFRLQRMKQKAMRARAGDD